MAGVLLATGALADPLSRAPTDRVSVDPHEDVLELSWSDAEDQLKGSVRPAYPRAGEPLHVSLEVGTFEGTNFQGPLVLTLREAGATHGESITVRRGDRHWETTFTPEYPGSYLLDVGFRTTHTKALHAAFEVGPSLVPRLVGYSLLMGVALLLLYFGGRSILRDQRPRPSSGEPSEPPGVPVAAAPPRPGAEPIAPPAAEAPPAPPEPDLPPAPPEPPPPPAAEVLPPPAPPEPGIPPVEPEPLPPSVGSPLAAPPPPSEPSAPPGERAAEAPSAPSEEASPLPGTGEPPKL